MKRTAEMIFALLALAVALPAAAQTGNIVFVARITPAAGEPEPVRRLPFYLLRKSFTDVAKEAEQAESQPDVNQFVDSLDVSKELKAWMKRTHSTSLSGDDFVKKITQDDVFKVPEFFQAYLSRNAGDVAVGFPEPKYKERDRERDPQKYKKQRKEYLDALRKFLQDNPAAIDGLDMQLTSIDPGQRWEQQLAARHERVRDRILVMAQTRYLVATTETDLDGRGSLSGLAPGTYWLSTLRIEAIVGDVRERWDTPVEVRAGQTTSILLSNLNAVPKNHPAP